jgi:hypothetical protein
VDGPRHKKRRIAFDIEAAKQKSTVEAMRKYFAIKKLQSNDEDLYFRISVIKVCMRAAIGLSKIDVLRPMLEACSGKSLTDSSHLRSYIPIMLAEEKRTLKAEFAGQKIVVIFDGTPKEGEVFAVVFRYCNRQLQIKEKLAHLGVYRQTFNHGALIFALNAVLSSYDVEMGDPMLDGPDGNGNVLAFMRDRAAVNTAAVNQLQTGYLGSMDFSCMSHGLCHVGEHVFSLVLIEFFMKLGQLMSHSLKAHSFWLYIVEKAFKSKR